jgi:deoxycytidylate deaminase
MHKLGAVVLNKGKITGMGFNQLKTHSGLRKDYGYYSQHAEARAVLNSNGCGDTIVVARRGRDGKVTMSKPCEKCMRLLKNKGIKKIFYTNWEGNIEMMRVK